MFIKAIYEPERTQCIINSDFIVDIFPVKEKWVAYTFDNERGGYLLTDEQVKQLYEESEG